MHTGLAFAPGVVYWALKRGNLTPRKYAYLPCGHFDFESAVTAQNDDFKGSSDSSYSRSLNVKT